MVFQNTCMILLMLMIIPACKAQLTTKHDTGLGTCQEDSALYEELKILKEELHRLHKSNAQLEEALQENQKIVNESLSRIETEVIELRNERETSTESAFMACKLSNLPEIKLYDTGEKLVFSEIVYNQGNHYNSSSGEYNCPVTGIYFFAFTVYGFQIRNYKHARVHICLHKTGDEQTRILIQNNDDPFLYISVSQAVVIQCNVGEKVWLETPDSYTQLKGDTRINIFSGILLRRI